VWLDPKPRPGSVAIDVSLLPDWENLFRFTGQAEGYAVYFGDIPPEAIVERDVNVGRNPKMLRAGMKVNPDLKEMRWYVIRGRTAPQFAWSLQSGGEAPAKLTLLHTKDGWFESTGGTLYKLEETVGGRYLYRYGAQIGKPTRRWYVETIELLDDAKKNPEKPRIAYTGLVVIEYFDDLFHIMLPTGEVWVRQTVKEAEAFANKWGKTHIKDRGAINVLRIDWRGEAAKLARQEGIKGLFEK